MGHRRRLFVFCILLSLNCLAPEFLSGTDRFIPTNTWGSSGAAPGQFNLPFGVLTDPMIPPSIYVADAKNNRVQKFDDAGNFLSAITGKSTTSPNPAGLAQWNGKLYVVDNLANGFEMFNESDGSWAGAVFPGVTSGSGSSSFNRPVGATFDNAGNLYVVDQFNYRVMKFDSAGNFLLSWGSPCVIRAPNGVILPGGVANACSTPSGGSLGDGQFGFAGLIAFAISDSTFQPTLLVSDGGNSRIEAFDTSGNFLFAFGSNGSANGQFSDPTGIAVEWHCSPNMPRSTCRSLVFVADSGANARVQVFDTSGNFITKFGLPAAPPITTPGTFQDPVGIAAPNNYPLDQFVYVTDRQANNVQQFQPMPDDDDDGIVNIIDTKPTTFSNDFTDAAFGGKTIGTITNRGGQVGFNLVVSPDISNHMRYSGFIRITTDPLGGPSPVQIKGCNSQAVLGVSPGTSALLKCGSATVKTEVGQTSFQYTTSNGTVVTSNLTTGQSLRVDPDTGSVNAVAGNITVVINGNSVSLAAGQSAALPPIAGTVSITGPQSGSTLSDFDMNLFIKPDKGHWKIAKLTPILTVSPKAALPATITVAYSNNGGLANGSIAIKDNGVLVGTTSLSGVQGSAVATVAVTLPVGAHQLTASLNLTNASGSSTASSSVSNLTVSGTIPIIDVLKFDMTGTDKLRYSGKLRYVVFANNQQTTKGELGDSSASFTALHLSVSQGQILCLREHMHVKFGHVQTATLTVTMTALGQTHTQSATIHVYAWLHCPRWKIDEVPNGPCCRLRD